MTTLSPLAVRLHKQFSKWQRKAKHERGQSWFSAYSRHLQNTFGDSYASAMNELREAGLLTLTANARYAVGQAGKGKCRQYHVVLDAVDALDHANCADVDYLAIRARTNLDALSPMQPYSTVGRNGDARVYTDFSQASKAVKEATTIDGEPLVQADVANAIPLFVGRELRKRGFQFEQTYLDYAAAGTLYDLIAEIAQCSRDNAKLAINRGFNAPGAVRFGSLYVIDGNTVSMSLTPDQKEQALAWKAFKVCFPKFTKIIRDCAKRRETFFVGSQFEARIRNFVINEAKLAGIPMLQAHDATFYKASDAIDVMGFYSRAMQKFGAFTISVKKNAGKYESTSGTLLFSGEDRTAQSRALEWVAWGDVLSFPSD